MRLFEWLLLIAICAYCAAVALLYLGPRAFLFPAIPTRTAPALVGLPQAEELIVDTSDGERLIVWHVPPAGNKPVVLFFHGNGDTLAGRAGRFRQLTAAGVGLVAPAFRGYAGSSGRPSEEGLRKDAAAVYAFATARYSAQRIALWGYSLGSGIAVGLAAERPIAKLILEAPFTSAVDVAAGLLPIIPVRLLMKDQFRSDEKIGNVKAPILMLHGERDRAISIAYGKRLFALAPQPKRFVSFPEGGHDDLEHHGAVEAVLAFLKEAPM
jgi:fermentation-respiration switch protein FrsA (DUF1100 family)